VQRQPIRPAGYALSMAETTTQSLDQRLEEIGAQLAWVRDYL
jgi:hypothetical protein